MAGPTNVAAVRVTEPNGTTHTVTLDEFRQYVARCQQAWAVEEGQLQALMQALEGQGAAVTDVLNKLRAEMSGLAAAFGIAPIGQQLLSEWEKAWPQIQRQVESMAGGYREAASPGLSNTLAALEANEQANMQAFERVLGQLD